MDIADAGQGGTNYPGPGTSYGINSQGDVVGSGSAAVGSGTNYALLWKQNGQVINLSTLLGSTGQTAFGINDADQVVGGSTSAFIYTGGVTYNLNNLINDPTWSLSTATSINNAGEIVGVGVHNGQNAAFLLTPTTAATSSQWITNGSGDWNAAANWNGVVPNSAGAIANFQSAITTNHTIYTDTPITAGTLGFNNSNTYVVTGSSTLTLLALPGNSAQVIVQSGTQELNLPVYIASNAVFNVSTGATLLIANPLTVIAGYHVGTVGAGTVTYQSTITLQSGASLSVNSPATASALAIAAGSQFIITPHATGASATLVQIGSLSSDPGSTIDIYNNAVVFQNGNLTAITTAIKTGYNAGSSALWGGSGITSGSAAADSTHLTAVGVMPNNDGFGNPIYTTTNPFEGTAPGTTDVLVKYTYYGDANLDGKVDGSDYSRIDSGYLTHASGWYNGDFNYDGVINGSDYTLIDNAYNRQGAALTALVANDTAQIAANAAVPEPCSVLAIALLGATRLTRRSRLSGSGRQNRNL